MSSSACENSMAFDVGRITIVPSGVRVEAARVQFNRPNAVA